MEIAAYKAFGENLARERKKRKLSIDEMAKLCQMSPALYRCCESGSAPSLARIVTAADALDVSLDWLLGRSEHKTVDRA